MQYLGKWDVFRKEKGKYVDKALDLLKDKRRIINLVALIFLIKKIKEFEEKINARKEYMRAKFSSLKIAIRCKIKY